MRYTGNYFAVIYGIWSAAGVAQQLCQLWVQNLSKEEINTLFDFLNYRK
jgi:hypothetical protein